MDETFQALSLNNNLLQQPSTSLPLLPLVLPAVKLLCASFYPLALSHDPGKALLMKARPVVQFHTQDCVYRSHL